MKKTVFCIVAAALLAVAMTACEKENHHYYGGSNNNDDNQTTQSDAFDQNGASKKTFSVSSFKRVAFSCGNLQYQASTQTWRFAEHQYDYLGNTNGLISAVNSEWIDLFGWGTSGWNSGAICYQPYSTSTVDSNYWPGGLYDADLIEEYLQADWGNYAAISNGGNAQGMWHTLNTREWRYLLGETGVEVRKDKWGMANILDMYYGLVILPDSWELPEGLSFTAGAHDWNINRYNDVEWAKMEDAGAIFLPAGGCRYANGIDDVDVMGAYWSSTHYNYVRAYDISFSSGNLDMVNRNYRSTGLSVRLVMKK